MAGQGMSDSFSSGNPMSAAQQMMRPVLPKRFYKEAAFAPVEGGFALTLDGRQARTPARSPLIAPMRPWRPRWLLNGRRRWRWWTPHACP